MTAEKLQVEVQHLVKASAADVYTVIVDYNNHHPHILPAAFCGFTVEKGGIGSGTVFRVKLKLAGKSRQLRMTVDEADPGSVVREISLDDDLVTTFEVTPHGNASQVRIHTEWTPASGIQGWFERKMAPGMLRGLYKEELINLDLYTGLFVAARRRELSRVA